MRSEYFLILNVNYLLACALTINNQCGDSSAGRLHQTVMSVVASAPDTCPVQVKSLTDLLVRDLPGYANRVIQQRRSRKDRTYSSIVTASVPELKPIDTISREYPPRFPQSAPTQVFISTLERQYTGLQSAQLQQFHWLFLAKTSLGWRLVNIYARTGGSPGANTPVTPPTESSRTVVGEAIRIWLNDCHLGKIRA
jgi:hypothetical protein